MESNSVLGFVLAGLITRDYILLPNQPPQLDVQGGSLLYAAAGLRIWETDIGLAGRVGINYPLDLLEKISRNGFDRRGIRQVSVPVELRNFLAYPDFNNRETDNPVAHFAQRKIPFPKELLEYVQPTQQMDSRVRPTDLAPRPADLPNDYLDATSAHLCPLDFLSHSLFPAALRQGRISTLTIDPGAGYMNPTFWNEIPVLVNGISAFLTSEQKLRSLFQTRSTDLWEMAEAIGSYGCEAVVVKRGHQGQLLYITASRSRYLIPAYPAKVNDPTGAGDAFCGGYLAGYRSTYDPLRGTLTGNISASMVVEGSQPFFALDALPGLANARLYSLQDMIRKV